MSKELFPPHYSRERLKPIIERGLYASGQLFDYTARDDGSLQVGYLVGDRFKTISDDIFYDSFTNLHWPRDANGIGRTVNDTHGQGIITSDTANAAVFGGYTDWRLPNIRELHSLVDYEQDSSGDYSWPDIPWTNGRPSTPTWTGTTAGHDTVTAWTVNFAFGSVRVKAKSDNTIEAIICRGGPV